MDPSFSSVLFPPGSLAPSTESSLCGCLLGSGPVPGSGRAVGGRWAGPPSAPSRRTMPRRGILRLCSVSEEVGRQVQKALRVLAGQQQQWEEYDPKPRGDFRVQVMCARVCVCVYDGMWAHVSPTFLSGEGGQLHEAAPLEVATRTQYTVAKKQPRYHARYTRHNTGRGHSRRQTWVWVSEGSAASRERWARRATRVIEIIGHV
ncbi:hypothetical protein LX36DRAFT_229710 [Colletotrichum falcatum]|nr:hypothetical protein LX36DRAFT_229710 [Colletotrichum falcatum]